MEHTILFVDDEKSILSSLRRVFRLEGFEIVLAESAQEAIGILQERTVSVIVSDMRMPEMDGIAFLKKAVSIRPDAVRILMTAYADIDSVMKAVNEGHIWRYITKPWDDNDLKLAVRTAVQFYSESLAHKLLLIELEGKNAELRNMNVILEEKVKERTWEIREHSRILNMIIEEDDGEAILSYCCQVVARIGGVKEAFLFIPFQNKTYSATGTPLTAEVRELMEKALGQNEVIEIGNGIAFSMHHRGVPLGLLMLTLSEERLSEERKASLLEFTTVIVVALTQQKMLKDAPGLLADIDNIIGRL